MDPYVVDEDPGVKSVRNIYDYYKQHRYETIVMGASFRRTEQILALAGCDRLTISPNLLQELQDKEETVIRKLVPTSTVLPKPKAMTKRSSAGSTIRTPWPWKKLADGIRQFAVDQRKLEDLLAAKL